MLLKYEPIFAENTCISIMHKETQFIGIVLLEKHNAADYKCLVKFTTDHYVLYIMSNIYVFMPISAHMVSV
jgi:hypothetical protein